MRDRDTVAAPRLDVRERATQDRDARSGCASRSASRAARSAPRPSCATPRMRPGSIRTWPASTAPGTSERGLTWVVRCLTLDILGPSLAGTSLTVTTEVLGMRRVLARRHGEIIDAGRRAGGDRRHRLAADRSRPRAGAHPARLRGRLPGRCPRPSSRRACRCRRRRPAPTIERSMSDARRSIPWRTSTTRPTSTTSRSPWPRPGAIEALGARPRRYVLEYQQAAEPGAALRGATWRDADGWAYRLTDEEGTDLLRARFSDG